MPCLFGMPLSGLLPLWPAAPHVLLSFSSPDSIEDSHPNGEKPLWFHSNYLVLHQVLSRLSFPSLVMTLFLFYRAAPPRTFFFREGMEAFLLFPDFSFFFVRAFFLFSLRKNRPSPRQPVSPFLISSSSLTIEEMVLRRVDRPELFHVIIDAFFFDSSEKNRSAFFFFFSLMWRLPSVD